MNFFSNRNNGLLPPEKVRYNTGRSVLLLTLLFTVLNCVILAAGGDSYYLYSLMMPYRIIFYGLYLTGKLPADYYEPTETQFLDPGLFYAALAVSAVIIALFLISYILSKKKVGWLVLGLVMFAVDCVYLAIIYIMYGFALSDIIDVLFHVWCLISLVTGVICGYKIKKQESLKTEDGAVSQPETAEVNKKDGWE